MKKISMGLTTADRMVVKILVIVILVSVGIALLTGCSKAEMPETKDGGVDIVVTGDSMKGNKIITFSCQNMTKTAMSLTRATLSEAAMTDLWVMEGETVLVHQTSEADDFGAPSVSLDYGEHTLCFVASRGESPTINGTTISWSKPSDTFWQSTMLTLQPQTATNQAVSLQRVATRLRISIADEIPATLASISLTPSHWYYGLEYLTGEATDDRQTERTVNVPSSYAGTNGQLAASFFSLSPSDEWTTTIALKAKASDNSILSNISIADVPMQRNRTTIYSGSLFEANRSVSVSADTSWNDDFIASW